ncbi:hypothetical protein PtA15_12A195 [Puccinia triticina]|uniref:Uncharacterized protein n=1 Tax=Puccinia triticina TaxID=208348 RepID=A0ABY7CY23_9BASI|nr:uncharacterized protein PtA15_12A195 [Puccinia triticina]WAQ90209.1 hypothetical protein PtA15_12A195 [Puccinia triticina]
MPSHSKVLCTCISQGCSDRTHSNNGIIKPGQRVSHATQRAHLLWEEQNRRMVSATMTGHHHPPVAKESKTPQPEVVDDGILVELFATLALSRDTQELSSEDSDSEPNVTHMENLPKYFDCTRFHIDFINKNRHLIEIVSSHGLDESSQPRGLNYSEQRTLDLFPKDPTTVIWHLEIDPDLNFLVCCP